uniref:Protein BANP n=1 Tax=Petromyzon marinus TaxID=7757 RepID=A0AAJ7UEJ2_PETMA|nr:protein BANP [Petromyzon marinus]
MMEDVINMAVSGINTGHSAEELVAPHSDGNAVTAMAAPAEPPPKRPRLQIFAGPGGEVTDDASLRALLVGLHEAVCVRLEAVETRLLALESRCGHVEEKLSLVLLGRATTGSVVGAPTVSMQAGSPWGVTHSSMKVRSAVPGRRHAPVLVKVPEPSAAAVTAAAVATMAEAVVASVEVEEAEGVGRLQVHLPVLCQVHLPVLCQVTFAASLPGTFAGSSPGTFAGSLSGYICWFFARLHLLVLCQVHLLILCQVTSAGSLPGYICRGGGAVAAPTRCARPPAANQETPPRGGGGRGVVGGGGGSGGNFHPSVTLITLNSEEDFPDGTWLGDESNAELRVRCPMTPGDLLHVTAACPTPEKMALTLLDHLFHREVQANSNLSGLGRHGKKQLDPLMVYGIRCHLFHKFGIAECDWYRIKQSIDSKCRTAWRRKQRGQSLAVKGFSRRSTAAADAAAAAGGGGGGGGGGDGGGVCREGTQLHSYTLASGQQVHIQHVGEDGQIIPTGNLQIHQVHVSQDGELIAVTAGDASSSAGDVSTTTLPAGSIQVQYVQLAPAGGGGGGSGGGGGDDVRDGGHDGGAVTTAVMEVAARDFQAVLSPHLGVVQGGQIHIHQEATGTTTTTTAATTLTNVVHIQVPASSSSSSSTSSSSSS